MEHIKDSINHIMLPFVGQIIVTAATLLMISALTASSRFRHKVSGQWSVIRSQWSVVSSQWSVVSDRVSGVSSSSGHSGYDGLGLLAGCPIIQSLSVIALFQTAEPTSLQTRSIHVYTLWNSPTGSLTFFMITLDSRVNSSMLKN